MFYVPVFFVAVNTAKAPSKSTRPTVYQLGSCSRKSNTPLCG